MVASAQIAIYPLRQDRLTPAIEVVQQTLRGHGLEVQSGPMSTYVVGEATRSSRRCVRRSWRQPPRGTS